MFGISCVLSSHRVASKLPRVKTSCNPRWMRATARVTLRVTNVGPVWKEEGLPPVGERQRDSDSARRPRTPYVYSMGISSVCDSMCVSTIFCRIACQDSDVL